MMKVYNGGDDDGDVDDDGDDDGGAGDHVQSY